VIFVTSSLLNMASLRDTCSLLDVAILHMQVKGHRNVVY